MLVVSLQPEFTFFVAIQEEKHHVAVFLVRAKADVNKADASNRTPLIYACTCMFFEAIGKRIFFFFPTMIRFDSMLKCYRWYGKRGFRTRGIVIGSWCSFGSRRQRRQNRSSLRRRGQAFVLPVLTLFLSEKREHIHIIKKLTAAVHAQKVDLRLSKKGTYILVLNEKLTTCRNSTAHDWLLKTYEYFQGGQRWYRTSDYVKGSRASNWGRFEQ